MKVLVVGDGFYPVPAFESEFSTLATSHELVYLQLEAGGRSSPTPSLRSIKEYFGDPEEVAAYLPGCDVLVVHAAPVTREVLVASSQLRLVVCARGGPVNVDIQAATELGVPVSTTPGKNADAVAELTIGFVITLARRLFDAATFTKRQGTMGASAFEGIRFFGSEIGGRTLGLIGYGQVGQRVARRAVALGMRVLAFDPYAEFSGEHSSLVQPREFAQLLAESEYLSLHARATSETQGLMGRKEFEAMPASGFFINTAREALVDERALYETIKSGHLAGAALDVLSPSPDGQRNPLLELENVVVTPHIGGATHDTLSRGARMAVEEILRFSAGERLRWGTNPEVVSGGDST